MSSHRYPVESLWPDYARAAGGLAISFVPMATLEVTGWVVYALSALGILCAAHLGQTVSKHRTVVDVGEDAIAVAPGGRWFGLGEIRTVRLAYFSVRKDGEAGWMELSIGFDRGRLKVDSRLEGFEQLTGRVVAAARGAGLELDETTELNLASLVAAGATSGRER